MSKNRKRQSKLSDFMKGLRPHARLDWSDLDPLLETGRDFFEKEGRGLGRALDKVGARILPLGPGHPAEAGSYGTPYQSQAYLRGDGVAAYERELSMLPRLCRVGEFRMARRHEFLRYRAVEALEACGFRKEEIKVLLVQGELNQDSWPSKAAKNSSLRKRSIARMQEYNDLRKAFLEGSLYMVMSAVHKYRNLGIDTLDLIQEGNMSLFQAIEGFDWRRSVRFKTYAEYWINQAFLKMLYNNVRTVRVPVWVQKLLKKIKDLQEESVQKKGRELSNEEIGKRLALPTEKVESLLKTQRYAVSLDQEVGFDEERGRMSDFIQDDQAIPVPDQVVDVRLEDRLREVMETLPDRERLILKLRFGLDGRTPQTLFEIGEILRVSAERVRQLQEAALKKLKLPGSRERLLPFAV